MTYVKCKHGQLRRQCEICDLDDEIATLREKLRVAEAGELVRKLLRVKNKDSTQKPDRRNFAPDNLVVEAADAIISRDVALAELDARIAEMRYALQRIEDHHNENDHWRDIARKALTSAEVPK